jgi:hypothetical protein
VWEKIELLKHHAGLVLHGRDGGYVPRQLDAVHHDAPAVVLLKAIDAADQGRFP